jgi:hypothetical protein
MAVLATTLALPALVYSVQPNRSVQTPLDTQPWVVVSFATALFMWPPFFLWLHASRMISQADADHDGLLVQ